MRVLRFAALVGIALILMAGCLAGPGPSPGTTSPTASSPAAGNQSAPLRQSGCASFYSYHAVPASYAASRLPPGLQAYPYTLRGTSGVMFASKAWSCGKDETGNTSAGSSRTLLYYLAVTASPPHNDSKIGFYWLPLEVITTSQALAELFNSWGFRQAARGTVSFDSTQMAPAPYLLASASSSRSQVTFEASLGPTAPAGGGTVRYFGANATSITHYVDIEVTANTGAQRGASLLRVTGPDAPSAGAMDGESALQAWSGGALSYTWQMRSASR